MPIRVQVPEKLIPLIVKPKPLKIMVGGRGSGKSESTASCMLKFIDDGERVLCAREFQNSIDDSVHSLLSRKIDDLEATSLHAMASCIVADSGGEGIYKGLARNVQSIKSLDNVKRVWIEEGQTISQESLDILFPTIRANGSEIWVTMNRGSITDPIAVTYLNKAEDELERCGYYEDEYMIVVEINWRDNPWFPASLEIQRQKAFDELPRAKYDHIWEGAYADSIDNAIIQPEWFDACIDAHLNPRFNGQWRAEGVEVCSFDPADVGDAKGWAYRKGNVFLEVDEKTDGDADDGLIWALGKASGIRPDFFVWDYTGIGSGQSGQIKAELKPKKIEYLPFNGAEKPDDPEKEVTDDRGKKKKNKDIYENKRASRYWRLATMMYNTYLCIVKGKYIDTKDMVSFSSDVKNLKQLRAELCKIPRLPRSDNVIQIMSKKDMLKKKIKSPNMADSVMMSIFDPPIKREPIEIEAGGWNG
jgi:phage terminase large subunit